MFFIFFIVAKNHVFCNSSKSAFWKKILIFFTRGLFAGENGLQRRRGDDDYVPDNAQQVGDLEEEKAPKRREEDLGIIKYRNFFRGRVRIRRRQGKLRAACRASCQQQNAYLPKLHGLELHDCQREHGERGKQGEEKDDERRALPLFA